MKKLLVLVVCALCAYIANAQKIIAIGFCNTLDDRIGKTCKIDMDNFVEELGILGSYIDYDVEYHKFVGEECSKPNLERILSSINCSNKDIIYFYYSGHGTHADGQKDRFPQMCLKYNVYQQSNFVALRTVHEKLQSKPARLKVLMADCCNNIVPGITPRALSKEGGNTEITDAAAGYYKKLFLTKTGSVILTSSKLGQTSGCDEISGGTFSSSFWDVLAEIGRGKIPPTWEKLTEYAKEVTLYRSSNKQEPDFDLGNLVNSTTTPPTPTPIVNVVTPDQPALADAIKPLLDTSKSRDYRLSLVNGIVAQYFSPNAMVTTVGRNLTTNIDYENITKFLKRLCVTERIKQINIISATQGADGKTSYMKVHEIRKQ